MTAYFSRAGIRTAVVFALAAQSACDPSILPVERPRAVIQLAILQVEPSSAVFNVTDSGAYRVLLGTPWPVSDRTGDSLLQQIATRGPTTLLPPEFEYRWSLARARKKIVEGSQADGITGIVESRTDGLGAGRSRDRAYVIGTIHLDAGVEYTIVFTPGPGFAALLPSEPFIRVERQ